MKRRILFACGLLCLTTLLVPRMAWAFGCDTRTGSNKIAVSTIPLTMTGESSSSGAWTTGCSGVSPGGEQDALRIESITLGPVFSSAGFDIDVAINGVWQERTAAIQACLWPSSNTNLNCTPAKGSGSKHNMRSLQVRVKRTAINAFTSIANNTVIATIRITQRSSGRWGYAPMTYTITSNGELKSVVPTCDVKDFDNKVLLPIVKATDLLGNGTGRYAKAKKPFTINLECKDSPKVSVTFTGTIMDSNDEVLKNLESNNPNVGIQLEYVDNYSTTKMTVKNGTAFQVLQNAGANETLNFNSYYYYKGGSSTVNGGLVKSNAEFLFAYE